MNAETKLRSLAIGDPTVSALIGTRWFNLRLLPGYINNGTCVRVTRVSTLYRYAQQGRQQLSAPRLQIDVLDFDPITCDNAAEVIMTFLGRISLAQTSQFDSPATTPPQFPNIILNKRPGMIPDVDASGNPIASKGPIFTQSIDVRIPNIDN